jgi:hypothetical protein
MKKYIRTLSALLSLIMMFPAVGCVGEGAETTDLNEPETSVPSGTEVQLQETTAEETYAPVQPDVWDMIRDKANGEGIKILFIGDSLTHYNEMPQIFAALAKAAGKKVTADRQTKGGTGIAMLREDPALWKTVSDKIASDNWDIVVYQPNRNNPVMTEYFPYYPWKEYSAAKDLVELIVANGSIPLQYSSFGVNKGSVTRSGYTKKMSRAEHTNLVTAYNAAVSEMLGSKTVYTGATFNTLLSNDPKLGLYHTDNSHPSLAGSYLIAADFYTVIFGESPADIAYTHGLDADLAATLRSAAAELLTFAPTDKAVIEFVEEPQKESTELGTLSFGMHAFENVSASGNTGFFNVSEDNSKISYTYKSGDGILYGFAYLEGRPVSGNSWTFEADVSIDKYCGSKNPTAGLQLIDQNGKMYRLYLRTTAAKIKNNDPATAEYHIRTDHNDSASRTDKGSFSNKIKLRVEVTPDSITLFVDGSVYMTINYEGTVFYDGTKSTKMTYCGEDLQLGLVTCYGDTSFSNVVIK